MKNQYRLLVIVFSIFFLGFIGHTLAARPVDFTLSKSSAQVDIKDTLVGFEEKALNRKFILLTIDDGPKNPDTDRAILEVLKKHSAHAIWFANCTNVDPAQNPGWAENRKVLAEIQSQGNLIANHAYDHFDLKEVGAQHPEELSKEIGGCADYLQKLTGHRSHFFRAPFGSFTPQVVDMSLRQGMEPMGWQTYMNDSRDTKTKEELDDWKKFYRTIRFESGDIILMHDTAFMLSYLDSFLTKLDQMNFSYVDPHNIGSQFFPEGYWR